MKKNKDEIIMSTGGQQTSNLLATAKTLKAKQEFAEEMIRGGLLPDTLATIGDLDDPEDKARAIGAVISVVEFGSEMGINPWIAVQNIHNIQGKPTAGVHIFTGVAQANGIIIDVIEDYQKIYKGEKLIDIQTTVEITRKYDKIGVTKVHRFTKTWSELTKAGLTGRDNYKKRPQTMLRTRAITEALRLYASSYFLGLYETTEMADVVEMEYTTDEEGNVTYMAGN